MQKKKFKVTPLERAWILYDVGNSAFVLMIATLVPIFFNALAEAGGVSKVNYLAYWGYASSVVTVVTAVLGPILGTLADTRNFKKPIFMLCLFVGVLGCCAMGAARTWLPFLVIFIVAKIGFSGSLVFYDSMLGDVTTPERMDMVSSRGYAWGYIGSCVPFVVCLALVLGSGAIGMSQMTALTIALFITAAWWLVTTLPLLRRYRQVNYVEVEQHAIRQSFVRIGHTLKHLYEDKQVFWFLLAFFCYIDGVYTIIDMATAYGTALGLDTTGLLTPKQLKMVESRMKAAREAAGDDVDIIMENHSYPDALGAVQLAKLAEKYNIMAFEEPNTPTTQTVEYIAKYSSVPIANGERLYSRWQYAEYFKKNLLQLAQPDIGNCGGITEVKKISDMAHAYDVGIQVHCAGSPLTTNAALHLECTLPNFLIHEHHTCNRMDTSVGLTKYNLQPENGYFTVPDLPGIGNEFLQEAIDRATLYKVIE